jgi:hypothetical protein
MVLSFAHPRVRQIGATSEELPLDRYRVSAIWFLARLKLKNRTTKDGCTRIEGDALPHPRSSVVVAPIGFIAEARHGGSAEELLLDRSPVSAISFLARLKLKNRTTQMDTDRRRRAASSASSGFIRRCLSVRFYRGSADSCVWIDSAFPHFRVSAIRSNGFRVLRGSA